MDYKDLQKRLDSSNMISRFEEMPDRFLEAFHIGYTATLPIGFSAAKRYLGVGMGGSGMGFRLVSALARVMGRAGVEVLSDYSLPKYMNSEDAVILTSFSGNTEEILAVANDALERGCKIICICSGGKLEAWAKENEIPFLTFVYPTVPRVGLPFVFGIAFGILCKAGVLKTDNLSVPDYVGESVRFLKREWTKEKLGARGKEVAELIKYKQAFILGADFLSPAAYVWKALLNENAKSIAFAEEIPEMCHNTFLGLQKPESLLRNTAIIMLQSTLNHPQNLKRMKIVGKMLKDRGLTVIDNDCGSNHTHLSEILAQILVGDYVSYYLALINEVDPVDTILIEELKHELV